MTEVLKTGKHSTRSCHALSYLLCLLWIGHVITFQRHRSRQPMVAFLSQFFCLAVFLSKTCFVMSGLCTDPGALNTLRGIYTPSLANSTCLLGRWVIQGYSNRTLNHFYCRKKTIHWHWSVASFRESYFSWMSLCIGCSDCCRVPVKNVLHSPVYITLNEDFPQVNRIKWVLPLHITLHHEDDK